MEHVIYFVLICILIAALVCDFRTYKIPNQMIIAGGFAGLIYRFIVNSYMGIVQWLIGTVSMIGILYLLYCISVMGAGDIKLLGIISGFLGLKRGIVVTVFTLVTAAVIAIILLIKRQNFRHRMAYLINFLQEFRLQKEIRYMDFKNKDKAACMHLTLPLLIAFLILRGLEIL